MIGMLNRTIKSVLKLYRLFTKRYNGETIYHIKKGQKNIRKKHLLNKYGYTVVWVMGKYGKGYWVHR